MDRAFLILIAIGVAIVAFAIAALFEGWLPLGN
jgi:hypothetical protein